MSVKVELFIESKTTDAVFILDDALKGVLDEDLLGGGKGKFGAATDITNQCHDVSTSRGRSRLLDTIEAGTAGVMLRNYDRQFDPPFAQTDLTSDTDILLTTDTDDQLVYGPVSPNAYGEIRPGKRLRISDESSVVFDGIVEDWNHSWTADKQVETSLMAVDALGQIGRRTFNEWTTTANQQPGDRLGSILDRPEVGWPIGDRDLDTGVSYLQGDYVSHGSSVLNYMQKIAETDQGRLFADRTGTLTYRDRHAPITAAVSVAFGHAGIPVSAVEILYGSEQLFTRVSVDRENGRAQTVTSDDTIITEFDIRVLELHGLLLVDDIRSRELAAHLLATYEEPEPAVSALEIILDTLSAGDRTSVVELEIGDIVSLDWTPTGTGAAVVQELIVEGVNYSSTFDGLTLVRLDSTQITDRKRFILDDTTFGVLDDDALAF